MSATNAYIQDEFYEGLLADFLDESTQLLERLNEDLLVLDEWAASANQDGTARCDDELMNSMFRSAHSVKGLSAMLGLQNIKHLTHRIENVFDAARKNKLSLDSNAVEVIIHSVDVLVEMVEGLRLTGSDDIAADEVLASIQVVLEAGDISCETTSQADAEAALSAALTTETNIEQPPDIPTPSESNSVMSDSNHPTPSKEVEVVSTAVPEIDHFTGITDETDVPPKYMAIFIDETEQSLDSLTETLLNVETENNDQTTQTLLITSHRIKGSAASLGLNRPAKLSHLMEDILQDLRELGEHPTSEIVDAMLKCTDALRHYVVGLKSSDPESSSFNELAHGLLTANALSKGAQTDDSSAASDEESTENADEKNNSSEIPEPGRVSGFDAELVQSIRGQSDGVSPAIIGRVQFQRNLPLVGLKGRLVYEKVSQLGKVFYCEPSAEGLEDLDTLDSLVFAVNTDLPPDEIRNKLQVSGVENIELTQLFDQSSKSSPAETAPVDKPAEKVSVKAPQPINPPAVAPSPSKRKDATKAQAKPKEAAAKPNETLRVDIDRLDQLMNLAGQLVINKSRFTQIGEGLKNAMLSKQTPQLIANASILANNILTQTDMSEGKGAQQLDLEAIRSNVRRLQSDLQIINREIGGLTNIRSGVNDLFEAVHQLDRVAGGIQQSVMDTRMVPIGPLFGRFRRVIRDITRANGKDIRLVIRGEKTELDKRMIDELGDPLIHMVRNSADHGIESPEDREAAGKPRQGSVTLDAYHRGNSIYIQIHDDGKGLDKDKIVAKAIDKQMVSRSEAEKMDSHQLFQLIWEPGLTTADKVTEISGRGMGMDIVRSKIEDLNGTVDVSSEKGVGTTFTIKLPLTLAILPSLMAEIEGDIFALPVESVIEIVTIPKNELATVHGMTTATIRGRVVSVVNLNNLFTWNEVSSQRIERESNDYTLVIIGAEGQELGLMVDSLLGEEDVVIKSMAENYQNVAGVAGASILGNGRVSLILDVNALIEMSSRAVASASRD